MTMNERFQREEALLGAAAMEKLHRSRVAVVGLGGVGSWCAEALCRAGVGTLYLIDCDEFSRSNINRQLFAVESTLGRPKAEAAAERLRDIDPACHAIPMVYRYEAGTREELFALQPDFVVDAVDLVSCKVDLIRACQERHIPIISALGTGNKKDAAQLCISDISKTEGCPLARVVRKELRAIGIDRLPVVYSPEKPMENDSRETPPPGRRSVPGSLVWVPAVAGLLLCQYVIISLAGEQTTLL